MHKVKKNVGSWKVRMKHIFTLTVLISNAHVMACEPTKFFLSGAYFLTNSLHSTVRKYTSCLCVHYNVDSIQSLFILHDSKLLIYYTLYKDLLRRLYRPAMQQ